MLVRRLRTVKFEKDQADGPAVHHIGHSCEFALMWNGGLSTSKEYQEGRSRRLVKCLDIRPIFGPHLENLFIEEEIAWANGVGRTSRSM